MYKVLIVSDENSTVEGLRSGLAGNIFSCTRAFCTENAIDEVAEKAPDVVLLEMNGHPVDLWKKLSREIKQAAHLPVLGLVKRDTLKNLDGHLDIDDFVIAPYNTEELLLRTKLLLRRSRRSIEGDSIKCGDLTIDLARCEVSVGGRVVPLTFREYELLKFMAGNPGRVFTRDALLNKVWGYDYYGGDRTVDVHIRRLRSKIEDASHIFIDTVRNIGYRFRKDTNTTLPA